MTQGLLLVVSAPSGAGKSTLCQALLERRPELYLSVSATTRPPRPSEKEGVDYFFMTEHDFQERVRGDGFLEWAQVHGHAYGTPRAPIEEALRAGRDVVLNIDTQGAAAIRKAFPGESVLAFLTPPSWNELEKRLRKRNQDSDAVIQRRLANAREELSHIKRFDYVILNDQIQDAVEDVLAILRAERRRLDRRTRDLAALDIFRGITL